MNDQSFLKTLSQEQLADRLKPIYDDLYEQLSSSQQDKINFNQVLHASYKLLHGQNLLGSTGYHLTPLAVVEKAGVSPCTLAVGMVVADVLAIVFQLAGINEEESRAAARAVLEELGQDTIRGIEATIHDFKAAESAKDKAKLMWKILSEIYNSVGIKGITKALKKSMHWYDYIISATTIIAQLAAWFGTDGLALIAELALEGVYIAQFTEDVVSANSACS